MYSKTGKLITTVVVLLVFMGLLVCSNAYADTVPTFNIWNGKKYVSVKATDGTNTTNCWDYANSIYQKIWGVKFCSGRWGHQATDHNILVYLTDEQRTITEEHTRAFISSDCAVLGSVIRVQACPLSCSGISSDKCGKHGGVSGHNHSMILVAKSDTGFTVLEARNDGRKTTTFTWKSFVDRFAKGYKYFKYIKSPNGTDYVPYQASTLEFQNVEYPSTYKRNTSSGWNLGAGTLYSNVNLVSIRSILSKNDGSWTQDTGTIQISGKAYAINSINSKVKFSQVPSTGSYTWTLTGKDANGRELSISMPINTVDSGTTAVKSTSKTYQEQPAQIPVENLSMNGQDYKIEYLKVGSTYSKLPDIYPSNATNRRIVFPEFDDGIISVNSNGTVRAAGSGWSGFAVCAEENPDIRFIYYFTVYDRDDNNPLDWYPGNLQVKKDGTIAFDLVTTGSGTFNHFSISFPGYQNASITELQSGIMVNETSDSLDLCTEDDYDLIQTGKLAHIETRLTNTEECWGTTQTLELKGGPLYGFYSIFPDTGLIYLQNKTVSIAAALPEFPKDFKTPTSLKTIDKEVFNGIAAKRIRISEKVTSINDSAFANCAGLLCVYIPEHCSTIASDAFAGDSGLIIYGMKGSYAETYANAKGFTFKAVLTLAERIRQYIMADGDYKSYDATMDLNNDGSITSADYIMAK